MIVRDAKPEDQEQIEELAKKYGLDLPSEGKIVVAETDEGEIKAFVNLRSVIFVEPFVAENPMLGKKLWDYLKYKSNEGGIKIMRCFAKTENQKLYEKLGFYEIFNDMKAMEINFWKGDK